MPTQVTSGFVSAAKKHVLASNGLRVLLYRVMTKEQLCEIINDWFLLRREYVRVDRDDHGQYTNTCIDGDFDIVELADHILRSM